MPLLETPKHSQASLAQSLVGSLLCSHGSCALFCLCPSGVSVSPVLWNFYDPTDLQCQVPWGFSVPLLDPQVGKSVVVPRTFATVKDLLWYNCSPVCGSPAWQLCGGASGNLFQEDLCHMLCVRSTHSSVGLPGFRFQLCDGPGALRASASSSVT